MNAKLNGRANYVDARVDGRIILKYILFIG